MFSLKKGTKIFLLVMCSFFLLFCLSGLMMAGSFSMNGTLEQREHYTFVANIYKLGALVGILLMGYLLIFVKTKF